MCGGHSPAKPFLLIYCPQLPPGLGLGTQERASDLPSLACVPLFSGGSQGGLKRRGIQLQGDASPSLAFRRVGVEEVGGVSGKELRTASRS